MTASTEFAEISKSPPENFGELQAQILQRHDRLSRQLQAIARFAVDNPDAVALATVTVLAQSTGVQPSAIVRFAKAFGFDGFSSMQQVFRRQLVDGQDSYRARIGTLIKEGESGAESLLSEFVASAVGSLEQLHLAAPEAKIAEAISILQGAKDIHLLGQRRSFAVVQYLHYALSRLERRCFLADGAGGMLDHQMARCGTGDVIIAVSFAPYTQNVLDLASELAAKGVQVIAITDSPLSPLARVSQVSFELNEGDIAFRSLAAPMCLAQTLVVSLGRVLSQEVNSN